MTTTNIIQKEEEQKVHKYNVVNTGRYRVPWDRELCVSLLLSKCTRFQILILTRFLVLKLFYQNIRQIKGRFLIFAFENSDTFYK